MSSELQRLESEVGTLLKECADSIQSWDQLDQSNRSSKVATATAAAAQKVIAAIRKHWPKESR